MKTDPVLRHLQERRVSVVHREPLDLFLRTGFTMPEEYRGCIETTHFELRDETMHDGEIKMSIKVGKDAEPEVVAPWISWHFSESDPQDVRNHCHTGLEKLNAILHELADLGLPAAEEISTPTSRTEEANE